MPKPIHPQRTRHLPLPTRRTRRLLTAALFGAVLAQGAATWLHDSVLGRRSGRSAPPDGDHPILPLDPLPAASIPVADVPVPRSGAAALLLALLALGTTFAIGPMMDVPRDTNLVFAVLGVSAVLWLVTFGVLGAPILERPILRALRRFRAHVVLAGMVLVLSIVHWLMRWELLSIDPPQRNFWAWALAWMIVVVFLGGLTEAELRAVGRSLRDSRWTGLLISLTTICLIAIGLEWGLRHVFYISNAYAVGLAHQRWYEAFWNPHNELDMRDNPIHVDLPVGTRRLMVLGDSFVAGYGIDSIDQTFPHVLGRLLGDRYYVNIIAQPGWNTDLEIAGLRDFPVKPDILIFSYYLNDIYYTSPESFTDWQKLYNPPTPLVAQIVNTFYLPNFLYWNVYVQMLRGADQDSTRILRNLYDDPDIWNRHEADLQMIVDWTRAHNTRLLVMVWPLLQDVPDSVPDTAKVAGFFQDQGIPTIDLSPVFADDPPGSLIVNPFDVHPNVNTDARVASILYDALKALPGPDHHDAKFAGQDLRDVALTRANLAGADLTLANLSGMDLQGADFSGATLDDADLAAAHLPNATLAGVSANRTNLLGVDLTRADLSQAVLSRAYLSSATLYNANLTGADASGAVLIAADLTGATLRNANLQASDLRGATLRGADLRGANLSLSNMAGVILTGALFDETTILPDNTHWTRKTDWSRFGVIAPIIPVKPPFPINSGS